MLKTILLPLTLSFSSVTYGSCLLDSPEIGDIGPGSQLVCQLLESRFPQLDIAILDRKIHSYDTVSVIVEVNDQHETMEYKLKGADWKLTKSDFLTSN